MIFGGKSFSTSSFSRRNKNGRTCRCNDSIARAPKNTQHRIRFLSVTWHCCLLLWEGRQPQEMRNSKLQLAAPYTAKYVITLTNVVIQVVQHQQIYILMDTHKHFLKRANKRLILHFSLVYHSLLNTWTTTEISYQLPCLYQSSLHHGSEVSDDHKQLGILAQSRGIRASESQTMTTVPARCSVLVCQSVQDDDCSLTASLLLTAANSIALTES